MTVATREHARQAIDDLLRRLGQAGLLVGIAALLLSGLSFVLDRPQFFRSYLVAYLLWLGVALGCLGMGLLYHLTGGAWGAAIEDILAAAAMTLPFLALLFLPIAFGLPDLYVWAQPSAFRGETTPHQQLYLSVPFFLLRASLYLGVWIVLAWIYDRWSRGLARATDPDLAVRLRRLAAGGLVALGLTAAFAMIDWTMSLDPTWTSTIYPAMVATGHLLVGFAFAVAVVAWLGSRVPFEFPALPRLLNDLGGLLLALVMLWAYLSYSQLLLIWAGNLNEEITWYQARLANGWQWVGLAIIAIEFVIPFILLLSRDVKRSARAMGALALFIVVGRLVDLAWLVEPTFPPAPLVAHWPDVSLALGLGGVWLAVFASLLRRRRAWIPRG